MLSFNTQILNDEGKYCIQLETDNRNNFELVQTLLRNLMDHKACFVTISNSTDTTAVNYFAGNN